jgi:hypothetical protein
MGEEEALPSFFFAFCGQSRCISDTGWLWKNLWIAGEEKGRMAVYHRLLSDGITISLPPNYM